MLTVWVPSEEMAVGGRMNSSVGAVSSLEGLWSSVRVPLAARSDLCRTVGVSLQWSSDGRQVRWRESVTKWMMDVNDHGSLPWGSNDIVE